MSAVSANTEVTALQTVQNGVVQLRDGLESVDVLSRITEFVLAVFAAIEYGLSCIPEAFETFSRVAVTFLDFVSIVKLIRRFREWFAPDSEGKMVWDRAWDGIASTVCLTVSHVIGFVKFLSTTLKAFALGAALTPLCFISDACFLLFSVFDVVSSVKTAKNCDEQILALEDTKKLLENAHKDRAQFCAQQYASGKELRELIVKEEAAGKDTAELRGQLNLAVLFTGCIDPSADEKQAKINEAGYKILCQRKIEQLDAQIFNLNLDKKKAWINVAVNVALFVLMVFSIVASFVMPLGFILAIIVAGIVASGTDVSAFIADCILKNKKVATDAEIADLSLTLVN